MTDRSFQLERVVVVLQNFERDWSYFDVPGQITLYCNRDTIVPVGEVSYINVSPVSPRRWKWA